jgi:hypothetical protein
MNSSPWREYSEQFAKLLFERHPEWKPFSRFESSGALVVEMASPNPNTRSELRIDTEREEVTVGFDMFHTHFFMEDDGQKNFEQAIDFVERFLNEEHVVLVYMRGDKWTGSMCCSLEDPWPIPEFGQRRYVRSWRGTYDAEMVNKE